MKRRRLRPEPRPWTPEEDAALIEISRIGLASDFWVLALPGRGFGEIAARRLELNPPRARLL